MKDQLDRIEEKLDKLVDKQSSMDTTLAAQAVVLAEHVKRSNMLEEQMRPVQRHVAMVQGALKLLGAVGVGGLMALLKSLMSSKGS